MIVLKHFAPIVIAFGICEIWPNRLSIGPNSTIEGQKRIVFDENVHVQATFIGPVSAGLFRARNTRIYDGNVVHALFVQFLDKVRQPRKGLRVEREVFPVIHVINVVPLNIDWNSSLLSLDQDFFGPFQTSVLEFALVVAQAPKGR